MPRRKGLSKLYPISYYRTVAADSPETAEQEALAQVLEAILPDTMDAWMVEVGPKPKKGDPTKGELDLYQVRVRFNRVKRREQ